VLRYLVALGFISAPWTTAGFVSAQPPAPAADRPGWSDVFVNLGMYSVTYEKPVVGKGEKPDTYSQKAIYSWTGGRYEVLEITLARDPAFKDKYSAEALKKEKNPPKELEVNKKKAWQWEFTGDEGKFNRLARRLVVMLDADKAIIIDQKGFGLDLKDDVAKKFDFAKVEKALSSPPKQ